MTDLTTMHLKCLLDQAANGPWESYSGVAGVPEGWDEYWVILQMGRHRRPLRSPHYPLEDEEYANFDLAAHAPELAEEVIRLRGHIEGLITAMEKKAAIGERTNPAVVAGYLKEIVLGETNE